MMYWTGGPDGWGALFMLFNMVVFWGLLIGAAILVARTFRRTGHLDPGGRRGHSHAEQVLAERYARGEIDDEEYGRRLEVLRRS
jgi:putative membrane protein